jgi:hypothetical protein
MATGRTTTRRCFSQARVDSETPSFAAITLVAPGVRFNAFAILTTPDFAFAIVFIVRTSSFVHARRTAFLALGILTPNRIEAEPGLYHDCHVSTRRRHFDCENVMVKVAGQKLDM